jgi:hypothetical protein
MYVMGEQNISYHFHQNVPPSTPGDGRHPKILCAAPHRASSLPPPSCKVSSGWSDAISYIPTPIAWCDNVHPLSIHHIFPGSVRLHHPPPRDPFLYCARGEKSLRARFVRALHCAAPLGWLDST